MTAVRRYIYASSLLVTKSPYVCQQTIDSSRLIRTTTSTCNIVSLHIVLHFWRPPWCLPYQRHHPHHYPADVIKDHTRRGIFHCTTYKALPTRPSMSAIAAFLLLSQYFPTFFGRSQHQSPTNRARPQQPSVRVVQSLQPIFYTIHPTPAQRSRPPTHVRGTNDLRPRPGFQGSDMDTTIDKSKFPLFSPQEPSLSYSEEGFCSLCRKIVFPGPGGADWSKSLPANIVAARRKDGCRLCGLLLLQLDIHRLDPGAWKFGEATIELESRRARRGVVRCWVSGVEFSNQPRADMSLQYTADGEQAPMTRLSTSR